MLLMPRKKTLTAIQKRYLMTIASELLGMKDVDIAIVFNTTKQNVNKTLRKKSSELLVGQMR